MSEWRLSCWYMYDNHTFDRLTGTPAEMVEQAKRLAADAGDCGMLCPPRWVRDAPHKCPTCGADGNKERSTNVDPVHARSGVFKDVDLTAWQRAVEGLVSP